MPEKLMKTHDLFWKEWRAHRWTLAALAGLIVIAEGIATWQALIERSIPFLWIVLPLAAAMLGAGFFSREELDEPRSFLHTLPLSRGEIYQAKLVTGFFQLAFLMILGLCLCAGAIALGVPWSVFWELRDIVLTAVVDSFVLYLCCAIALYHMRRSLTAFILGSGAAGVLFVGVIIFKAILVNHTNVHDSQPWRMMLSMPGEAIIEALLLAGWLGFLYCRTPLAEQTATARFLLWALWVVAFLELFVFLFFTGWRDLFYLLTGV